ncbi:MAG: VWA domain-containing protein [Anaerolineae bacterium]|nr:VWA domain-containing protein [Anaerolineae bacterium]
MSKRLLVFMLLVLVIALSLAAPHAVLAQLPTNVVANFVEVEQDPEKDGLNLKVYFVMTDGTGAVSTGIEPAGADVILSSDEGGTIPAQVVKAADPISVVLVLDVSGSMSGQISRMRNAAINFVDKLDGARFALITFDTNVKLITPFTEDKDRLKREIQRLQAGSFTCLYDAAFRGVEQMAGVPKGRRAVVVFTDGKDAADRNANPKPCSTKTPSEVVEKANDPGFKTPIYTIGFEGSGGVDAATLTDISSRTRGISSISADIQKSFDSIFDALNSQFIATAFIQPKLGDRQASLQVKLGGGSPVQNPATIQFTNTVKDFTIKPTATITLTPTLPPVTVQIDTISQDEANKALIVTIIVKDDVHQVKEYRFDVNDNNGILKKSVPVPAPVDGAVSIPIGDLPTGQYKVRVTAILNSGGVPARSSDAQINIIQTPTPSVTPSDTPIPPDTLTPVSVTVDGITYEDDTRQSIAISLKFTGLERVRQIRIKLMNNAGFLVREFPNTPVQPVIGVDLNNIPSGDYTILVSITDDLGIETSAAPYKFTHELLITPSSTPSASPSPTSTPTPIVYEANPTGLRVDLAAGRFVITIQTQNSQDFAKYQVIFRNKNGLEVYNKSFAVPPADVIQIETKDFVPDEYTVEISALSQDNRTLATGTTRFTYSPPTPTPTYTVTPTPPLAGVTQCFSNEQCRPVGFGIAGIVVLGLVTLVVLLTRRPKKAATGTGFLAEMTGAVNLEQMRAQMPPTPGQAAKPAQPAGRAGAQAAPPAPAYDMDKTSPVPYAALPTARLIVEASRDAGAVGKEFVIDKASFTIGRKQRDLNFDGDDNVSRAHAEITIKGNVFYITDNNSTHHTYIDEQVIQPGVATPLYNGAAIRLGSTTIMRFKIDGSSTSIDLDKTNPVQF